MNERLTLNPRTTNKATTIVATVDGNVPPYDVVHAVAEALRRVNARLIYTNWQPDRDTIAEQTGIDFNHLTVIDFNASITPSTVIEDNRKYLEEANVERPPKDAMALYSATCLVTEIIKPLSLNDLLDRSYKLGEVANLVTEIADQFDGWLNNDN